MFKIQIDIYLKISVLESQLQKQITPSLPDEAIQRDVSRHIGENYYF